MSGKIRPERYNVVKTIVQHRDTSHGSDVYVDEVAYGCERIRPSGVSLFTFCRASAKEGVKKPLMLMLRPE
jgi:hypothetical protein